MRINRRIIVEKYGEAEELRLVEEPLPEPGDGQVRIKVVAAGVALADVMRRKGVYPGSPDTPFTPGYDFVGDVEAAGPLANPALIGRRVAGMTFGLGGYTEYICAAASEIVPISPDTDPHEAVAAILNYVSAYQMLHRVAEAKPGQTMLVLGASGGVGTALLELGKLAGARLIGTASAAKQPGLRRLGAELFDDRTRSMQQALADLCPDGVDVIFDPYGSDQRELYNRWLAPSGQVVAYGITKALEKDNGDETSERIVADWLRLAAKPHDSAAGVTVYSATAWKRERADWFVRDLAAVQAWLERGNIKPIVGAVYPLEQAQAAHRLLESRTGTGKIVLSVS